jgi:hypothetical protein
VAIHPGGKLGRRSALAVMAVVAASAVGHPQARPAGTYNAQFAAVLSGPGAEGRTMVTGTSRYAHGSTLWGHQVVTDLQIGRRTLVTTDFGRLAAFGSSTVEFAGPQFGSEFRGLPFYNGGRGGEVAEETLARLGSRPVRVDAATIPPSGPVILRAENMAGAVRSLAPYSGTLAGVKGTVSPSGRRQDALAFTRTRPGSPVRVREGADVLPGHGHRGCILILNLGKNNLNGSRGTRDVNTLLQWTRDAVAWNGGTNALVMGHFVNTYTPRSGSELREGVTAYNTAARAEFGGRFFDLGGFISSFAVWEYAGITPTAADRREQASGNKPPSLSSDSTHLNPTGAAALARRVHEHLSGLGWLPTP